MSHIRGKTKRIITRVKRDAINIIIRARTHTRVHIIALSIQRQSAYYYHRRRGEEYRTRDTIRTLRVSYTWRTTNINTYRDERRSDVQVYALTSRTFGADEKSRVHFFSSPSSPSEKSSLFFKWTLVFAEINSL